MLIVQFDELGEVTLKCRNKVLKFVDLFFMRILKYAKIRRDRISLEGST